MFAAIQKTYLLLKNLIFKSSVTEKKNLKPSNQFEVALLAIN